MSSHPPGTTTRSPRSSRALWGGVAAVVLLAGVAAALLVHFAPFTESGKDDEPALAAVLEAETGPDCALWIGLPEEIQASFARGYADRVRERLPGATITGDEIDQALDKDCALAAPTQGILELIVPLVPIG